MDSSQRLNLSTEMHLVGLDGAVMPDFMRGSMLKNSHFSKIGPLVFCQLFGGPLSISSHSTRGPTTRSLQLSALGFPMVLDLCPRMNEREIMNSLAFLAIFKKQKTLFLVTLMSVEKLKS